MKTINGWLILPSFSLYPILMPWSFCGIFRLILLHKQKGFNGLNIYSKSRPRFENGSAKFPKIGFCLFRFSLTL